MPNTTSNNPGIDTMQDGPFIFDLPVAASTRIYKGALITQLAASGMVVPYSTALSGVCVGVSQHEVDNSTGAAGDKRLVIESKRLYAMSNGTAGDAFSEATLIGAVVYGTDDNTAAKTSGSSTRKAVGFFMGMESDGKVRVLIDPTQAKIIDVLQTLTAAPATATALRDNIVAAFG